MCIRDRESIGSYGSGKSVCRRGAEYVRANAKKQGGTRFGISRPVSRLSLIHIFTYSNMGYGSALAWLMVVIIGILTAIVFKTSDKWVYEG